MKRLAACVSATLLFSFVGGLVTSGPAAADTILNLTFVLVDEPQANACNGEPVVLSGQEHLVLAITVSDGNTLIKVHTDTHLKGIGTSLDTYVDSETNDSEYHFGPSDSFADIVSTHLLVSQSNTPNFLLVTTTKIDLSTSLFVSRGAGTKCTG
ncbi:MAG: hypothetical protein E6H88_14690 [Chloroflexi bacterium]|nr:MAG: hypothetical protein E6H88_14690 [Chloroflexota bacterium]